MALRDIVVLDLGGGTVKLGSARQPQDPKCAAPAGCRRRLPPVCRCRSLPTRSFAVLTLPPSRPHSRPRVFPNATAKLKGDKQAYVGEGMLGMRDVSALSLRRPVDRGYCVAWDLQREILAR